MLKNVRLSIENNANAEDAENRKIERVLRLLNAVLVILFHQRQNWIEKSATNKLQGISKSMKFCCTNILMISDHSHSPFFSVEHICSKNWIFCQQNYWTILKVEAALNTALLQTHFNPIDVCKQINTQSAYGGGAV